MMNLNGLTKIFTGNGGTIRFAIAGVTILGIVGTVVEHNYGVSRKATYYDHIHTLFSLYQLSEVETDYLRTG